jgi:lipoate-protein ligase A
MVRCRLILSEPASGAMNMALDEALLESVGDEPVLRIYQWSRPTLSLGYFQAAAERDTHEASRTCDVVRRPSGGGAILHDRELTYCLVLPEALAKTQPHTNWYFAVHRAPIESLQLLTGGTSGLALCQNPPEIPVGEEPFLCFQRRAEGDVLFGEQKIAGSAQRRRGGAILQHGSVLLERSPHAPELPGICDLVEHTVEFAQILELLAPRIAERLSFRLRESMLDADELDLANQLHATKYNAPTWTERR